MEKLSVFKLGGKILDNPGTLQAFLQGFAALEGRKILVHGGGVAADQLAAKLGIPVTMHEGRRITSPEMRDLAVMVYGGLLNKQIVAQLQKLGCDAIGLSGADGKSLVAQKRKAQPIDYGMVGDIKTVNTQLIETFLELEMIPVFAPLTWSLEGELLNSNADGVACAITEAFSGVYETYLLYCFDKAGVLLDVDDQGSVLKELDKTLYEHLKRDHKVNSGMLPKLDSCFRAKTLGAHRVLISSPHDSLAFMTGASYQGTLIS